MFFVLILTLALTLSACAGLTEVAENLPSVHGHQVLNGELDFNWRLQGDRSVGPAQVFSDLRNIWLQWHPGQQLPIITASSNQGETMLIPRKAGALSVIEGNWEHLVFRRGRKIARANHNLSVPSPAHTETNRVNGKSNENSSSYVAMNDQPIKSTLDKNTVYSVDTQDLHIRSALSRWAKISGWRFDPEHWAVDVDIPLSGHAKFTDDFDASVRKLIESTELSDKPLQPCFYSNRVLRVIPISQACDPSVGSAVSR